MRLGLHLLLADRLPHRIDPIAGIPLTGRWQTHRGDRVPLGLYQDTACTLPATAADDPVMAFRDEITGSLSTFIAAAPGLGGTLQFDNGNPCIRTTESTRFTLDGAGAFFGGSGGACTRFRVDGDGGYGILTSDDAVYYGHYDRFAGDGCSYPSLFLAGGIGRIDSYRPMPTAGPHTLTTIHDGAVWENWLNGLSGGAVSGKPFGFKSAKLYLGGGTECGSLTGAITALVIGPAWTPAQRMAIESHLATLG